MKSPVLKFGKFNGKLKATLGVLTALLAALALVCVWIARGPDRELRFEREVSSESSIESLNRAMEGVANWPSWFYSTADAKILDALDRPLPAAAQGVKPGSIVRISIDPRKGRWKRFELRVQVVDFEPGKRLKLRVTEDSKGRLTSLFDYLDWQIELIPQGKGTLIRGSATARTRSWRSRLFGTVTERILMHQVFYPDLFRLSQFKQPVTIHPQMAM